MQPYINPNYMSQYSYAQPTYNGINGMYVDNRSVVDATQCDLSGKPMYFPTTDGQTIYSKQLDNFGKSHISTYARQDIPENVTNIEDIMSRLSAIEEKIDKLRPVRKKENDKEVE